MPTITPGDFTATDLIEVRLRHQQMFPVNLPGIDDKSKVDVWKAIKAEQTATPTFVEDPNKDLVVRLQWMGGDPSAAGTCADLCTLDGPEMGSLFKDYELTNCSTRSGKVKRTRSRTNEISTLEETARVFAKIDQALAADYTANAAAALEANVGANEASDAIVGSGAVTTLGVVSIPTANWNQNIFSSLYMMGALNELDDLAMINGTNLWQANRNAQFNAQNADGKSEGAQFAAGYRTYWDLFNIDAAPDFPTYMMQRGTLALVDKAQWDYAPVNVGGNVGQMRFKIDSAILPGVSWDFIHTTTCVGQDIFDVYMGVGRFDTIAAPLGENENRTGIIKVLRS